MKTIDQILKIKAVVLYILKAFPEGVDYIHPKIRNYHPIHD